jgi:hypothetical protein
MEEPYQSIQSIGEAAQALLSGPETPAEYQFSQAQVLQDRLVEIKSGDHALPVEWEQYLANTEMVLYRIQADTRPKLDRQTASQLTLQNQATRNRHQSNEDDMIRSLRYEKKQRFKIITITAGAIGFILLVAAIIGIYQWQILSSDEGWFHDVSLKRWSVLEKRIHFGKSIETRKHNGLTAFLIMADEGTLEDLQKLASLGADINASDDSGKTALHYAAAAGHGDSVEWLISQGIDVNIKDHSGATPLHYFFQKAVGNRQSLNTFQLLLSQGAATDTANKEESLLMAATLWVRGAYFEKPTDILAAVIEQGADVNYIGNNGSTALKNALAKYLPDTPKPAILVDTDPVVRLLMEAGAEYKGENLSVYDNLDDSDSKKIRFLPGLD